MKMKKSQLKEAVKAVVRECLNERVKKRLAKEQVDADVVADGGSEHNAVLDKVVKFAIRKLPGYDAETLAKTAGDLFTGITGGQTLDPSVVAAAVQKHMKVSDTDTLENPSECGTMQDEAGMTSETGEESEEMPSIGISGEEPPTDIPGAEDEEPHVDVPGAEGEEHGYDEQEEIKLIKVMKLVADKLAAMHDGQLGAEPSEEPSAPPFGGGEEEPEEEPSEEPKDDNDEPFEKSKEEPEGDKEEDESPVKEAAYKQVAPRAATDAKEDKARRIQTEPKVNETTTMKAGPQYKTQSPRQARVQSDDQARKIQFDPKMTEAKKKMKENHRVQARSYVTVKDNPNDPNVMRDPENPQSNGA